MAIPLDLSRSKHVSRIRGLFYTTLKSLVAGSPDINLSPYRDRAELLDVKVTFLDDSELSAMETIREDAAGAVVTRYTYVYERSSGFFFSYDMEGDKSASRTTVISEARSDHAAIRKPAQHLHVGCLAETAERVEGFPPELREHGGPHFGTPPATLEGVLALIVLTYFNEREDLVLKLRLTSPESVQ